MLFYNLVIFIASLVNYQLITVMNVKMEKIDQMTLILIIVNVKVVFIKLKINWIVLIVIMYVKIVKIV